RRRHTRSKRDWSSDVCSSDLFIFIESSWHGNESEWTKKIAYVTEEKHSYIKNLISYAKSLDIPVVFWNKEDPVHYDHFIETAKQIGRASCRERTWKSVRTGQD